MCVMLWEEGKARSSQGAWGHIHSDTIIQGHRRAQHILVKGVIIFKRTHESPLPRMVHVANYLSLSH